MSSEIGSNAPREWLELLQSFANLRDGTAAFLVWERVLEERYGTADQRALARLPELAWTAVEQVDRVNSELSPHVRSLAKRFTIAHLQGLTNVDTSYWQAAEGDSLLAQLPFCVHVVDVDKVGPPVRITDLDQLRQHVDDLLWQVVEAALADDVRQFIIDRLTEIREALDRTPAGTTSGLWASVQSAAAWFAGDSSLAQELRSKAAWPLLGALVFGVLHMGLPPGGQLGENATEKLDRDPVIVQVCAPVWNPPALPSGSAETGAEPSSTDPDEAAGADAKS